MATKTGASQGIQINPGKVNDTIYSNRSHYNPNEQNLADGEFEDGDGKDFNSKSRA